MGSPSFEDRIFGAIVERFFEPELVASTVFNPNTSMHEPALAQMPSAAARIASDIFAARKDEILAAVKDHVDVDDLAERIAVKVGNDIVERLGQTGGYSFNGDQDRVAMRDKVRERVADELARRHIAQLDAVAATALAPAGG